MTKICLFCATRYAEEASVCATDGRGLVQIASGLPFPDGLIAGRFPAVREIGSGAMGTVYHALHPTLRAQLAVKLIKPELIGERDSVARFKREAQNAFAIVHPNVVRVHDLVETGEGELALVMDFVDGVALTELIPDLVLEVEQLSVSRVKRIVRQIADGLDAAHAVGIAHRDLKPANVMVSRGAEETEIVKLVDFGLAKVLHLEGQQISHAEELVGTPEYFSPEQAAFAKGDFSDDRYALALIAFELLTGALPFPKGTVEQLLVQRRARDPMTLAEANPSLAWPASVQRVFDRAFAKEREARHGNGSQFAREFNEAFTFERLVTQPRTSASKAIGGDQVITEVLAVAPTPRLRGKVKTYSLSKRWGVIRGRGGIDHRVDQKNILGPGFRILAEGENVEYEAGSDGKDQSAKRVKRLDTRLCGTVAEFDIDLGYGRIVPDGQSRRVFVHYKGILPGERGGVITLEEGERVEFELQATPKGESAVRVVRLDPRTPLDRFADLKDFDTHLRVLAEDLAQKENWSYREIPSKDPFPILRGYIFFTFPRLLDEGKLAEERDSRGRRVACFNTGLVTALQEEIFAYFEAAPASRVRDPNHEFAPPPPWLFIGFVRRDDRRLAFFGAPPPIANYFTSPADLLYDLSVELVVDWEHILARRWRFPASLQQMDDTMLKRQISQTIEDAKSRVRRNYKTAIPQFYRGSLQLLLPLCLEKADRADLALVVMRDHRVYRATTVLPLDWAIRNARLIARPDREWLDP